MTIANPNPTTLNIFIGVYLREADEDGVTKTIPSL